MTTMAVSILSVDLPVIRSDGRYASSLAGQGDVTPLKYCNIAGMLSE